MLTAIVPPGLQRPIHRQPDDEARGRYFAAGDTNLNAGPRKAADRLGEKLR